MRKIIALIAAVLVSLSIKAQSNSEKINLLLLNQKYPEALQLTRKCIENNPDSAYYYYQHALVNKLMYRYSDAKIAIENALTIEPENIDYISEYAVILDKKEKEHEAAQAFIKVVKKDSSHFYSGIWLSNYYLKNKEIDKALPILNTLFRNDSSSNYIARNIGLCWYKKGIYEESKKWFSKAIQLDSTDIKAYRYLFSTYAGKEKYELAFETIDKAIRIEPKNKNLYIAKGDLHVIQNHHFQAVRVYRKAYELDPSDADVSRKLGLSYYKIKKYDKSKRFLLLADKGQMYLEVYKHLGYLYKLENMPDSSTQYFNKALEILRADNNLIFNIYIEIAENYVSQEYYEHSIGWYEKALRLELMGIWAASDKNKALIDLASVYSDKLNDKKKAIELLEKVTGDNSIIFLNKEDYFSYAQKEISRLKEELFFEGNLN